MSNNSTKSTSLSFSSLLTILFITLKLTGYITWSWLWVLSPLWIPIIAIIVGAFIYFLIFAIIKTFE